MGILCSADTTGNGEEYISMVQDGYLGEYTDMTVQEFFDGYYTIYTSTWDNGSTEDGENIVEVIYTLDSMHNAKIQFTLLDEQVFKITSLEDSVLTADTASNLPAELNYRYVMLYAKQHESEVGDIDAELALFERLDQISASSVLYGASSDYTGDRAELYSLFGDSFDDASVTWLLDHHGYLDMSYYTDRIDENDAEPDSESYYIFPSDHQYITEADMSSWDQNTALLARNEIYARHGYVFQTQEIQNYFAQQPWYVPDSNFSTDSLSAVEKTNVETISTYEQKMGWAVVQTSSPEDLVRQAVKNYFYSKMENKTYKIGSINKRTDSIYDVFVTYWNYDSLNGEYLELSMRIEVDSQNNTATVLLADGGVLPDLN